jgi:hypothetical protein
MTLKIGLALGLLALASTCHAQTTSNLLTNPGAETGNLTDWTVGGASNPGVDNGSFDGGINPHTGSYDFYGGNGANGSLTQNVSLVGTQGITAAEVNSGLLSANLSFWEQGLNQGTPSDDAQVSLTFLNAAGGTLGTFTTPEVDSHLGSWQEFDASTLIPADTQSIDYSMLFDRHSGSDLDAFVDDNSLTVSANPVPEASTTVSLGLLLMLGLGGMAVAAKRKKSAAQA